MTEPARLVPADAASDATLRPTHLTGLPLLTAETWVLSHLGVPSLYAGYTNLPMRVARLRAHIIANGLADVPAAQSGSLTWKAVFQRLYHEDLGEAP